MHQKAVTTVIIGAKKIEQLNDNLQATEVKLSEEDLQKLDAAVDWPEITLEAVEKVTHEQADEAIVMCWTGTGCSIAANKVPGIRAALCHDAETARGARHANVLALSLRATPEPIVKEILDRWFDTPFSKDEWNLRQMARLKEIEKRK